MERTKGELKLIYSLNKHSGDVFVKTKDTFICKFYGIGRGVEAKEQALVNATYFKKSWSSHDKLVEACKLALHNEGHHWHEIKKVLEAALASAGD